MSTSELRQRRSSTTSEVRDDDDDFLLMDSGLTAPKLLKSSPQQDGDVLKLHISPLYEFFPKCLQRILLWWPLSLLFAPKWERRYLILLGSFLYKFVDSSSPTKGPKGSPVPLDSVKVHLFGDDESDGHMEQALINLPSSYTSVFVVRSFRTTYYYATSNRENAQMWVNSLRQARQEVITRSMGHAPSASYPPSFEYFDRLGKNLMERKERIRTKIQEQSTRELEMSNLMEGGPVPRGYYG